MAVSEDRKFTKEQVYNLLEGAKGKTLGEVDKSHQFVRTLESTKITGIAGDVIEQSVFGYKKDRNVILRLMVFLRKLRPQEFVFPRETKRMLMERLVKLIMFT